MTENVVSLTAQAITEQTIIEVGMSKQEVEQAVEKLLLHCGLIETANRLTEPNLHNLSSGIEALFLIDRLGRRIEQRDEELEEGSPHAQAVVEKELAKIATGYHEEKDWLEESVTDLVILAGEQDSGEQPKLRESILARSFNYTHALVMASFKYRKEGVDTTDYLNYARPQDIGRMEAVSDIILAPALRRMV